MSLDVYLKLPGQVRLPGGSGIFVRDNGATREITRAEWDEKFPGSEPYAAIASDESNTVFTSNITHNMGKMASEAGIYKACWRPEELGITTASQLIPLLRAGLLKIKANPEHFKQFNPANGWGNYLIFVPWVEDYLRACESFPAALVSVSR